jgi:two-component system sensor histidine kinase DesK
MAEGHSAFEIFGQDLSRLGPLGVLRAPAARRWLIGAAIAIAFWAAASWGRFAADADQAGQLPLRTVHVVAFMLAFALIPPFSWGRRLAVKLSLLAVLAALSLGFFAYDPSAGWYWTYVAVAAGFQQLPRPVLVGLLAGIFTVSLGVQLGHGLAFVAALNQPALIVSIGLLLAALSRQAQTLRELRATQHELAELAVAEERHRVARDLHDILGHSLTVVAVKAELARRLVRLDPDRAEQEASDVEELARGALADVRATVRGYRGVTLAGELAEARAALDAAGIEARLPSAVDSVASAYRELFGWVLREGVTNVIRHSRASVCEVALGPDWLQIDDDGVGPTSKAGSGHASPERGSLGHASLGHASLGHASPGHGLDGLRARAREAGLKLEVGPSEHGGFRLRVGP